jgi:hypothetical protein
MFAEGYRVEGGETSSGNRLFVGNLTMDTFEFVPEIADEVQVGFEHSAHVPSPLDNGNSVAIETITIAHEGVLLV